MDNINFSVNDYDFEGEPYEMGIYLHFNEIRIKVANDFDEWKDFVKVISSMTNEIEENWKRFNKNENTCL